MTPLQRYAALTDTDLAVADAVEDLEAYWGTPPTLRAVAEFAGLPIGATHSALVRLSRAGAVEYRARDGIVAAVLGVPVVGVVE